MQRIAGVAFATRAKLVGWKQIQLLGKESQRANPLAPAENRPMLWMQKIAEMFTRASYSLALMLRAFILR